jgi:hypothetical protein
VAAVGATALIAATLLPPTVAIGTAGELEGAADDLAATCSHLGNEPIVLIKDRANTLGQTLAPILRGWCGATVAIESPDYPLDEGSMDGIFARAEQSGRPDWLIGAGESTENTELVFSGSYSYLELTLFEPPSAWLPLALEVVGTPR